MFKAMRALQQVSKPVGNVVKGQYRQYHEGGPVNDDKLDARGAVIAIGVLLGGGIGYDDACKQNNGRLETALKVTEEAGKGAVGGVAAAMVARMIQASPLTFVAGGSVLMGAKYAAKCWTDAQSASQSASQGKGR